MDTFPTQNEFYDFVQKINKKDEALRNRLEKQPEYKHKLCAEGSYPYIPQMRDTTLYKIFLIADVRRKAVADRYGERNPFTYDFLDVGAGTGRIVALARFCGLKAVGLEYSDYYINAGRKAYKLSDKELVQGDAFEMTKEFVEQFPVIYTYMPIKIPDKMTQLHFSMYLKARYDTLLVETYPLYYPMRSFEGKDSVLLQRFGTILGGHSHGIAGTFKQASHDDF